MIRIDFTEEVVEIEENFALDPLVLLITGAPHGKTDSVRWHTSLWSRQVIEPEVTSSMGRTEFRNAYRVNERSLRQAGGTYEVTSFARMGAERHFNIRLEVENTKKVDRDDIRLVLNVSGTKSIWIYGNRDPIQLEEGHKVFGPTLTFTTSTEIAVNEALQTVEISGTGKVRPTAWERIGDDD
jgi:hypothetical protein